MKKFFLTVAVVALSATIFVSCNKSEVEPVTHNSGIPFTLDIGLPESLSDASFQSMEIVFTDVSTGAKRDTSFAANGSASPSGKFTIGLKEGTYNIVVDAVIRCTIMEQVTTVPVHSERVNVAVAESTPSLAIAMSYFNSGSAFVIEEIFFTGTLTPEGKQYTGDKYFKITNNSDATLYADGIAILESEFLTTNRYNYKPNIMAEAFAVDAVYVIPGSGTDVPVAAGASLIICDNAINHTEANANSFNLGKGVAAFEWYDVSSNVNVQDIDNPEVANMDKWYASTLTIWGLHNRGFKSYAIARMQTDAETFLAEYAYHYEYEMVIDGNTYPMDGDSYRAPNSWIIDAVNLSVEAGFEMTVTDPSLDMGWTYCGKTMSDATRYGKAVRRKVERTVDGRSYLKDTNNTTSDFDAEVTPSLMQK